MTWLEFICIAGVLPVEWQEHYWIYQGVANGCIFWKCTHCFHIASKFTDFSVVKYPQSPKPQWIHTKLASLSCSEVSVLKVLES